MLLGLFISVLGLGSSFAQDGGSAASDEPPATTAATFLVDPPLPPPAPGALPFPRPLPTPTCRVGAVGALVFDAPDTMLSFYHAPSSSTTFLSLCRPLAARDLSRLYTNCSGSAVAFTTNGVSCSALAGTRGAVEATRDGFRFSAADGSACAAGGQHVEPRRIEVSVRCDERNLHQVVQSVEADCGACCHTVKIASSAGCPVSCERAADGTVCGGAARGACNIRETAAACRCRAGFSGHACETTPVVRFSGPSAVVRDGGGEPQPLIFFALCGCVGAAFVGAWQRSDWPQALFLVTAAVLLAVMHGGSGVAAYLVLKFAPLVTNVLPRSLGGAVIARGASLPAAARVAAEEAAAPPLYSSFSCTAGSQVFTETVHLQETQRPWFPAANDIVMRACRFRNVCLIQNELTYYANPASEAAAPPLSHIGAFKSSMLYPGYFEQRSNKPSAPKVVLNSLPAALPFAPRERTYLLETLSYPFNIGHVLVDTVMPVFGAADVFGFNLSSAQLINAQTCDTYGTAHDGIGYPAKCRANLDAWLEPFLAHPMILSRAVHDACYGDLIVGHEVPFSLTGLYLHRAKVIRDMRRRLLAFHGFGEEPPLPSRHTVLVFNKVKEIVAVEVPSLCATVQHAAATLTPPPRVECITPAHLGVREQLEATIAASVMVVEHGTTSYGTMWQLPGAAALIVVPTAVTAEGAKEPQVLLFNADVQAFYTKQAAWEGDEGAKHLALALQRVGARWGLAEPQII